jgi:hypothetical protein
MSIYTDGKKSDVIHTANILGIFNDPFEFEGDYGPNMNPTRAKIFELVVSPEALAKNLSDARVRKLIGENNISEKEISDYRNVIVAQAVNKEKDYGPTLSQLITPELIEGIKKKQIELQQLKFTNSDLEKILYFIERYGNQKAFRFLRNTPAGFLNLDKALKDQAARESRVFDLPILGSTGLLKGQNGFELKKNLIDAIFDENTFSLTTSQNVLKQSLSGLKTDFLKTFLGDAAINEDLEVFTSPAGQVFFFWMYQTLDLHLIANLNVDFINQVNKVKELFATTLGDPAARAKAFRDKLIVSGAGVVFTQESDALVPQVLTTDGLFLPVDDQNPQDGTFVFLRSDLWKSEYQIIPIKEYAENGCMNVVVATRQESGQKFLLAACHGHSTQPEDGRRQISLVMEIFHKLSKQENLQLLIGTDANTKTQKDVQMFKEHIDSLGLTSTDVGPTTVKRRMVTAQHAKAGRFAIDQEDYLITLKPESGGQLQFSHVTVGFKEENVDINKPLPNIDNPSDHYSVGATMVPCSPAVKSELKQT